MNKRRNPSPIEPRKAPKQERSRKTYQDILQGATRLIQRDGIQKLSTNKVAEESGVSIGSLYQYFPSKQAIIAALIDHIFEVEYHHLKESLEATSPGVGARRVIKDVLSFYFKRDSDDRGYRRALIDAVTSLDATPEALRFQRAVGEVFVHYLTTHYPPQDGGVDAETTQFFVQYMMRTVVLSSLDEDIAVIDKDLLIAELCESLMNFLKIPDRYREGFS